MMHWFSAWNIWSTKKMLRYYGAHVQSMNQNNSRVATIDPDKRSVFSTEYETVPSTKFPRKSRNEWYIYKFVHLSSLCDLQPSLLFYSADLNTLHTSSIQGVRTGRHRNSQSNSVRSDSLMKFCRIRILRKKIRPMSFIWKWKWTYN